MKSLYLFGDSITFGQYVSPHLTWANIVSEYFSNKKEFNFLVQSTARNGETSSQALQRLYYDCISHDPNYVMIQFGMNDCNYWATENNLPRVSKNLFYENIIEIVERIISGGSQHCFLNTNHPSSKGAFRHLDFITYEESNSSYNQVIRKAFKYLTDLKRPISLVDNEKYFLSWLTLNNNRKKEELVLKDGVHLSEIGHKLYSENIINSIVEYLNNK